MSITIPYPGGKGRLARFIISQLPKQGRSYVEPFVGRGNLFWAATEAGLQYDKWWINDIVTIPFFRAVKHAGHMLKVPIRCRAEFERQRQASLSGDSTAILLEPYLTFSGGGYFGAGCKGSDGMSNNGVSLAGYQKTIGKCHGILHQTKPKLSSLDWRQMGLEDLGPEDTVVLDPPYPNGNVRSYSDATVGYEALVDLLLRARFRWILCGYPHPVLCRLGKPFWARDVNLLCIRGKQEPRTECLWRNPKDQKNLAKSYLLPEAARSTLRDFDAATSLSFPDLDAKIDKGLGLVAKDWNALVPYLLEMHTRLSAPGKRTDLRRGAPVGLSWTAWVESKRHKLGRSLRAIQYLLKGQTESSRERQMLLAQRRATLRSEPDSTILGTPMEIATEMARLILEMRDASQNAKLKKKRLALMAEDFLRITGQERNQDSIAPIQSANRTPRNVVLTM
jgi:D12 class N6 adenine-specific DNA methyltransferase